MSSVDINHHLTHYGLWYVQDPVLKYVQQIHPLRISVSGERIDIYTKTDKTVIYRTLYMSDYGKLWFRTKKEALFYLNSLTK